MPGGDETNDDQTACGRLACGWECLRPDASQGTAKGEGEPQQQQLEQLKLYNSLTRTKDVFVPRSNGGAVNWYSCGPTVYDASHMGHARSYITFDILRRVMQDYFGIPIKFVMNITDVDDKIILRARQHHLYTSFVASNPSFDKVKELASEGIEAFRAKIEKEEEPAKKELYEKTVASAQGALDAADANAAAVLDAAKDPISVVLDKRDGASVNDTAIFTVLTQRFEKEFFDDMDALNVQPPDVLTRVTEYVDEIIAFVKTIIDNGFGYESNGSVYFDTPKYASSGNHTYAKIKPEAVGDMGLLADGEGALGATGDKRSPRDFALWKASKPGEPAWDSPWGKGRPGWHIECSAMCHEAFHDLIDIHSGGVDLCFPHHDNEIAQSEAFYNCPQWCNYFLHSGHLEIEGRKMSKSLKNFITIREALDTYTASQLRILFLQHGWNATLDYSASRMTMAVQAEKTFKEFFLNITSLTHGHTQAVRETLDKAANNLYQALLTTKRAVHTALCDSVDTPTVMRLLRDLVTTTNVYVSEREQAKAQLHQSTLVQIAQYITGILKVFGVICDENSTAIGFASEEAVDKEEIEKQTAAFTAVFSNFFGDLASKDDGDKYKEIIEMAKHL